MSSKVLFIFNPEVEAVQGKLLGITFVAVGFGLVFYFYFEIWELSAGLC